MLQLRSKFLDLAPGSRIVANTFGIEGWSADENVHMATNCTVWCTALLWIVPARVAGTWRYADGEVTLTQEYQMVAGSIGETPIVNGRLRGELLSFTAGGAEYSGRVAGDRIEGTVRKGGSEMPWNATRATR
jgi:hypothetical protein